MTQPLLIVKQRPMAPYGHVMVPLDFSLASEVAMSVTTAYFTGAYVSEAVWKQTLYNRRP